MRVIVAGSRTINDRELVFKTIETSGLEITTVISGCCSSGVDKLGEAWAASKGIPVDRYPANWEIYGRMAGPIRNGVMAQKADALILVWDGKSAGSSSMKSAATNRGLKIVEIVIP